MSNVYCPHCMTLNEPGSSLCRACKKELEFQNEIHQLPLNTILKGRYLVGKVICQGGFGITYIGMNLELQQRVAIKEFFPSGIVSRHHSQSLDLTLAQSESSGSYTRGRARFLAEARLLARFDEQPNIVSVKDYFTENETAYIVMEYLDGKSLRQLLSEEGNMSFDRVFSLLSPIMPALGEMHRQGLIHRDISPSNIMLLKNGTVKLLDFGTTRTISQEGEHSLSVVLKPGFAPPEQYQSHGQQSSWTDVYSLCATMYKLLCGITPENSLNRVFDDTLTAPRAAGAQISPQQEAVLLRGMTVDHRQRIQTMEELHSAFSLCSARHPKARRAPPSPAEDDVTLQPQRPKRREKRKPINKKAMLIWAVSLILCLALASAVTLYTRIDRRYNEAIALAEQSRYFEACSLFLELGGYKDSRQRAEALRALYPLAFAEPGELISFGSYEQDGNSANGKEAIQWLILSREDNRLLIISKSILDYRQFGSYAAEPEYFPGMSTYDKQAARLEYLASLSIPWSQSDIRKWLNGYFYNNSFTHEEQQSISFSMLDTANHPSFETFGGGTSTDKVFLLSLEEVFEYFPSQEALSAASSQYANAQGLYADRHGKSRWWIRSPGKEGRYAMSVDYDGSIPVTGLDIRNKLGIRPALWLYIE